MMKTWTRSFFLVVFANDNLLQTSSAFLAPAKSTMKNVAHGGGSLFAMPDNPSNWFQSDSYGGYNNNEGYVQQPTRPSPRQEQQQQQQQQQQGPPSAYYDPNGRDYYPDTTPGTSMNNPQPQQRERGPMTAGPGVRQRSGGVHPDQWTPGPMQQGSYGYGMETRDAWAANYDRRRRGEEVIQGGGSRKTWQTSHQDQTIVQIGSEGRPIYTKAQVWEGPGNTPASMTLYSEDGAMRPWNAAFQNTNRGGGGSSVLDLRNTGPVEFPQDVTVMGKHDGSKGITKQEKDTADAQAGYQPSPEKVTQTVQGQSLKYFNVKAGVGAVKVELSSEGRPMYAQVELWQGPGSIKQCAEIYSDNGSDRVWSAVIETQGRECTVAVRNVGPGLVYPFKASVDPMF